MNIKAKQVPQSKNKVTTSDIMDFLVKNMVTKAEFQELDDRVSTLEGNVSRMEKSMVTKTDLGAFRSAMIDYIDKRLAKTEIELGKIIHKGDLRVDRIVDVLLDNKLITSTQAKKIQALAHS